MSKLSIFVQSMLFWVCLFVSCTASAQNSSVIYSQDFEVDTAGITDLTSSARVVSENAKSGNHVLRGNLMAAVVDPITGKQGSGWLLPEIHNLMGSKSARDAAPGTFVRFWLKFDDATWDKDGGPGAKLGYFWSDIGSGNEAEAIWPVIKFESGWVMGRNSSTGELNLRLSENWPTSDLYLHNPDTNFQPNGNWNLIELWFDYTQKNARGYNYFNIWVNKNKLTDDSASPFADGDFDLPDDFRLKGWQFFHTNSDRIDGSIDGNGYAVGYEIDDIQVWSGRPNAPMPPVIAN